MAFTEYTTLHFVAPLGDVRDRGIRYPMSYGKAVPPILVDEDTIPKWSESYMNTQRDKLHPTDLTVTVCPLEDDGNSKVETFILRHDQKFDPDSYELGRYSYDHKTTGKVIQALLDGAYRLVKVDDVGQLQADGLPDLAYQGSWAGYNTYHALQVWPWTNEDVKDPKTAQMCYKYNFIITVQCTIDGHVVDDSKHSTDDEIKLLHRLYDHQLPERMTAAEFTALREALQLPVDWLADRWEVRRRSILRWQSGDHMIPDYISMDMRRLEIKTKEAVDNKTAEMESTDNVDRICTVPRGTGEAEDGMPKSWHRMVGRQAARSAQARLAYQDDDAVS